MPQNTLGYIVATGNISFNNVESVDSKEGVFGLSTKSGHWERGYSLGSYIFGKDLIMDYRDHRYDHEYGHFLQSKKWGLFWSPAIGLPSLLSSWTSSSYNHKDRWFERNASKLGGLYFDEHYGTGAPGYVKYSKDYFSLEYFNKGGNVDLIPYYHPMHQGTSQSRYQTEKDRFHFTFLYHLIVLTPLLLFL
jgi:hypothetical protein